MAGTDDRSASGVGDTSAMEEEAGRGEGRGGEGVGGEANGRSTGRKGGCRRKQEPTGGFDTVLKASDLHFLRPLWACGQ